MEGPVSVDESDSLSRIFMQAQLPNSSQGKSVWFYLFLVLVFILINGFFSASEMAVVMLNDHKLRSKAQSGDRKAEKLLRFIDHQARFLATIQVGVTLAGFLSAAFGADSIAPRLYAFLDKGGNMPWLQPVSTIMVTIVISFLSLVLGELVPKRIGMYKPEIFANRFASLLLLFENLFDPFTKVLNAATGFISKLLGLGDGADDERVTEEEIRLLTDMSQQSGSIHREEAEMINKVFELDDKEVSEIMTPRTAVLALSADDDLETVRAAAIQGRFSRIPVYEGDIDNIIGILHIRDLIRLQNSQQRAFDLRDLLRPAYFIPGSKSVNVLFREMRHRHLTLAIVIDEYGGTDGIISMEDVLEEIVGDIEDEYDRRETACIRQDDGSYILDGRLSPEEAGHYVPELGAMEEDDAYDTLAGFVLSLLERIPDKDEQPTVYFKQLAFTVLEMDDRRIAKIRLRMLEAPEEDEG